MSQAQVSKLVSRLRIKVNPTHRRLKNPKGPEGRHEIIRQILTGLFKYERIELIHTKAKEARGYAERLISEAIRHGDCHKPTMELADYWLSEKQQVHKLFKVLAPRFQHFNVAYTRIHKLSRHYQDASDGRFPRTVLELRGNPFPPLTQDNSNNRNLIHNILLDEAKKEFRAQKYAELAEQLSAEDTTEPAVPSDDAQDQADSQPESLQNEQQSVSDKGETSTCKTPIK